MHEDAGDRRSERASAAVSRIVVALDGTTLGEAVLPHVQEMARHAGCRVTLVRAWVPDVTDDPLEPSPTRTDLIRSRSNRHEIERYLDAMAARLRGEGVRADWEILEGPAGEMIVDEAEGLGADMIAMATRGRTVLGRLVLGSVTEYVMRHAECPVLLVRGAEQSRS